MNVCSESLHILYLIDEIKVKGGTEKHLFELSTGMADAGFRVSVFTLDEGAYSEEFKNNSKIYYQCLNITRIYDFKGLFAMYFMARYISNHNVDIIQTFHTASDLIGPLAAQLSLCHPKVISSRRDLGYTKSLRHVKIQRYINYFVDSMLANSTAVKNSIIDVECYAGDKIIIIYNGINVEPFKINLSQRNLERNDLNAGSNDILIGSVGNIRPVKGYDLLVEAASIVCRDNSKVKFFHAGDGDTKDCLVNRCRELGLEHKFMFLGAIDNIAEFLSLMDIYVQPSRSEGFSNSILEAMVSGLPVVATSVGGNKEIIDNGRTGYLVEPECIEALAGRLLELSHEEQTRKCMGLLARENAMSNFTFLNMIRNYERYYNELL